MKLYFLKKVSKYYTFTSNFLPFFYYVTESAAVSDKTAINKSSIDKSGNQYI